MLYTGISRAPQIFIVIGILVVAVMIGAAVPIYVSIFREIPVYMVALPVLILLSFLLVLNPRALLLLIVLFRASSDELLGSSRLSIGGYTSGVGGLINAFVIFVVLVLVVQRPSLFPKKFLYAWMPFLLMVLYGVLIAPVKGDAIRLFLVVLTYFAMFVSAFYIVKSIQDFGFCARIVLWSSIIPAAYAIVDLWLEWRGAGFSGIRLESTFPHANVFAFYLTLVVTLCLYMLKSGSFALSAGKRMLLSGYVFYLLALLLLTQTRSAWIVCATIFTVYGLFFERRYLVYVISLCLLALLLPPVHDRLLDLTIGNEYVQYAQLNSFTWRRLLWESALQWMQPGHYLLGYGAGSFAYYSPTFFPLAGATTPAAHNVYIEWFFQFGAAGLLAFIWLFYRMLRAVRPMFAIDRMAAFVSTVVILGYLIDSLSDNMIAYLALNWYFWFMIGAAAAVVTAQARPARSNVVAASGSKQTAP